MMNLKKLLTTPLSQPISKGALLFLFIVAGLGFIDAAYLTVEHYVNAIPPCAIGSCETVLTSQYSNIFGVPISLFGALYYLIVLILFKIYLDTKKEISLNWAFTLIGLGTIISIILILLQAFVIHAYCLYCMTSDILSIILFVGFWIILKKYRLNDTI